MGRFEEKLTRKIYTTFLYEWNGKSFRDVSKAKKEKKNTKIQD